jgi:hypothetical protein
VNMQPLAMESIIVSPVIEFIINVTGRSSPHQSLAAGREMQTTHYL